MTYEQLENCYKTALKQRDEAEEKVKLLVSFIDDVLFNEVKVELQSLIMKTLNEAGV